MFGDGPNAVVEKKTKTSIIRERRDVREKFMMLRYSIPRADGGEMIPQIGRHITFASPLENGGVSSIILLLPRLVRCEIRHETLVFGG
jgi:hypothetical protein